MYCIVPIWEKVGTSCHLCQSLILFQIKPVISKSTLVDQPPFNLQSFETREKQTLPFRIGFSCPLATLAILKQTSTSTRWCVVCSRRISVCGARWVRIPLKLAAIRSGCSWHQINAQVLVEAIRCLTGLDKYEYLIHMIFTRNIHETVAVVAVATAVVLIALQPVAVLPLVKRVGCMIACLVLTKQAAMVV